jgi:HemY protein
MKARLLWLVTVLALGGLAGLLISRDPGYVLVAYDQMAVETSLWFALVLLVVGYWVVRVTFFIGLRLARGRGAFARWNVDRRARAADQRTLRGLVLLAAGRWAEARKQLTRAAPRAGAPVVNLLAAARAAQELGDPAGRDALLREARAVAPDLESAVDFSQAILESSAGQWADARATLERLRARDPGHAGALWLLADCCRALGDWHAVAELVPQLRRDRNRPATALAELETAAAVGRLGGDAEPPERVWAALSKAQRHQPEIAAAYARAVAAAEPDAAERALREALQHDWNGGLVGLYGCVASSDPARQLAAAESWVKAHPDDARLFLALGRLALRNRRWPQAREHFEMSIRLGVTSEAQAELGRLLLALGESRGPELLLAAGPQLPELPLPAAGVQALP